MGFARNNSRLGGHAIPDLLKLLVNLGKAIWRAVNVWRKEPEERHTAAEYADALLFPPDNKALSDPSHPPLIYRR